MKYFIYDKIYYSPNKLTKEKYGILTETLWSLVKDMILKYTGEKHTHRLAVCMFMVGRPRIIPIIQMDNLLRACLV